MARYTRAEKEAFAEKMRRNPTGSEALLYDRLKPYGFVCQQIVLGWIVDLYHPDTKTVVEVDGGSHVGREVQDYERDTVMTAKGFQVWRIEAGRVIEDVDGVANMILDYVSCPWGEILDWWEVYDTALRFGHVPALWRTKMGLIPETHPWPPLEGITREVAVRIADEHCQGYGSGNGREA